MERRDGEILGPERSQSALGVDDAFPIGDVDEILPGLLEARSQVYMNLGEHAAWDERVLIWLSELAVSVPQSLPRRSMSLRWVICYTSNA